MPFIYSIDRVCLVDRGGFNLQLVRPGGKVLVFLP